MGTSARRQAYVHVEIKHSRGHQETRSINLPPITGSTLAQGVDPAIIDDRVGSEDLLFGRYRREPRP